MVVRQTASNEILAAVRNAWLLGELHLPRVEYCLVAHDRHLRLVVPKWLHAEQKLVEYDAHAPDVNLGNEKQKGG